MGATSLAVPALAVSTQGNTGGNTGSSQGTWVFVGSNNITLSQSTGAANVHSIYVSGPAVTNSSWTVSDNATSGTVARLAFTNQNGITLSLSTGAGGSHTIVGSHNALTSQSNQAFSAAGGSSAFQTLTFADNAYASFTNTNGSLAVTELRGSFFAVSNTTQSSSGTQNLDAVSFAGAGIASVGVTNGSVIISVPAGGGGGDGVNIIAAGTQTANTTGTVVFSNSNNVTFGMSNSSVVTASINPYPITYSSTLAGGQLAWATASVSFAQNNIYIMPVRLDEYVSGVAVKPAIAVTLSSSAASSGQVRHTINFAVYTRNNTNSTVLASHYSTSYTISGSYSSNASMQYGCITGIGNSTSYNSTSSSSAGLNVSQSVHGNREALIIWSSVATPGDYYFAFHNSSAATATAGNCIRVAYSLKNMPSAIKMHSHSTGHYGLQLQAGIGLFSTTTNAFPTNVTMSDLLIIGYVPVVFWGAVTD